MSCCLAGQGLRHRRCRSAAAESAEGPRRSAACRAANRRGPAPWRSPPASGDAVGDITHRVDVRNTAATVGVDRNRAVGRQRDAGAFDGQALGVGHPPGGEQHRVELGRRGPAAFQRGQQGAVGMAFDPRQVAAEMDADALFRHLAVQVASQVVVEAAQDLLAAIRHRDLAPRPCRMPANSTAM